IIRHPLIRGGEYAEPAVGPLVDGCRQRIGYRGTVSIRSFEVSGRTLLERRVAGWARHGYALLQSHLRRKLRARPAYGACRGASGLPGRVDLLLGWGLQEAEISLPRERWRVERRSSRERWRCARFSADRASTGWESADLSEPMEEERREFV